MKVAGGYDKHCVKIQMMTTNVKVTAKSMSLLKPLSNWTRPVT